MTRQPFRYSPTLALSSAGTLLGIGGLLYWLAGVLTMGRIDADLDAGLTQSLQALTAEHRRVGDPLQAAERVAAAYHPRSTNLIIVDRSSRREFNARRYLPPDDPALVFLTVPLVDTIADVLLEHGRIGHDFVTASSREGGLVRIHMREVLIGDRRLIVAQSRSTDEVAIVRHAIAPYLILGFFIAFLATFVPPHLVVRRAIRRVIRLDAEARVLASRSGPARLPSGESTEPIEQMVSSINTLLARQERDATELRALLAVVSHELRTPITVLASEVQNALDRDDSSAAGLRQSLRSIRQEVGALRRLVDDLFLVARAGAGEDITRPAPTYLDDVVRESVAAMGRLGGPTPVVVISEADYSYLADETMLRRAITNLVANAQRHATSGEPVRVTLARGDSAFTIDVWNQGPPIPADELPRIFERFFRGSRAPGGAGLGLQVVQLIVAAHGGGVSVNSGDEGTTFRITLPPKATPI